jgi:hypothetical protein
MRHRFPLVSRTTAALLLAAAVGLGACGSDVVDDSAAPITTPPDTAEVVDTTSTTSADAAAAPTSTTTTAAADADIDAFPSVIGATATPDGDDTWRFDVTISSPYDTPERYADAWRVLGPDGTEYGIRILGHDHANEQPFTRSKSGIAVPADVQTVTIQGRDLANGWGGPTFDLTLPGADG